MVQADRMTRPLLLVVGPTASGKSALGLQLAERLPTDIVSCDSMQIYRGMDIGTAKPSLAEQRRVRHHLIDICEVNEEFSVSDYVRYAQETLSTLAAQKKTPLFVGGTGLYVNSLLFSYDFGRAPGNAQIRGELEEEYRLFGPAAMYDRLKAVDPESAAEIHPNNVKRVIRALEIYLVSGKRKSESRCAPEPRYRYLAVGLHRDRDALFRAIDARVEEMLARGLVEEVRSLIDKGYPRTLNSLQGIGYKEIIAYLAGECSKEEAVESVKLHTRHYAKRQITWFKKLPGIQWIDAGRPDAVDRVLESYRSLL